MALGGTAFGCDKKESGGNAPSPSTAAMSTTAAAPAVAPAAGDKCEQAAIAKAKVKKPGEDPSKLASVEFDKQDCRNGKWSTTKADCYIAAKTKEDLEACK